MNAPLPEAIRQALETVTLDDKYTLDHGRAFRQKARAVGIPPAATVRADTLSASSRPGTIA